MNIAITNAKLFTLDAESQAESDLHGTQNIYLSNGRIASIGAPPQDFAADKVIDAAGKMVCPGFVDLAARLREPGAEHKAHLESELLAAAAGGVTSIVCPPDTDPVLDEPSLVDMLKRRAAANKQAQVYPLGALTRGLGGKELCELVELTQAGCVGFSQANAPLFDTAVLRRSMQYAATFGYAVWLRAEDSHLSAGGVAHEGEMATRLGLGGIPVAAETLSISKIIILMRETGAKVHLERLSSGAGVALVRQAKAEGLPLTADVGVHHLHLSDRDIGYFDPQYRFTPPLRDPRDRDALSAGLLDGTIDAICSDHTPVDADEKLLPFAEATPGATGLELLLPLTLKWASQSGESIARALSLISAKPAQLLGLSQGVLKAGSPADITIFDPQAFWAVTAKTLRSQGHNSPYLGREMQGKVTHTIVAGRVIYAA